MLRYGPDIFALPCFHEMDPDSLFSLAFYRKKKPNPDHFCCTKALCKCIFVPYHLLHVSLKYLTVVSRMYIIALFNHKPSLIVTCVKG